MPRSRKAFSLCLVSALKTAVLLFLFVFMCFAAPGRDTVSKQPARSKSAVFTVSLKDSSKGKDTFSRARVSKRDSGAVIRDQAKPAKTAKTAADSASAKTTRGGQDTVSLKPAKRTGDTASVKAASHTTDTAMAKKAAHKADTASQKKIARKGDTAAVKPASQTVAADSLKAKKTAGDSSKPAESVKKDTAAPRELSEDSSVEMSASQIKPSRPPAAIPSKKPTASRRMLFFRIAVFIASIVLIIAAVALVRRRSDTPRFLTTTRLSVMDKEVQKACRYIEKNYSNPALTVKTLCAALVTGEAFLEALMERDLGITVGDFITHVRINRARMLMEKDPSLAKETAAQQTGFADADSFGAAFKKITGSTFEDFSRLRREKA
jgi:AraC-like DNA-binding protein